MELRKVNSRKRKEENMVWNRVYISHENFSRDDKSKGEWLVKTL